MNLIAIRERGVITRSSVSAAIAIFLVFVFLILVGVLSHGAPVAPVPHNAHT